MHIRHFFAYSSKAASTCFCLFAGAVACGNYQALHADPSSTIEERRFFTRESDDGLYRITGTSFPAVQTVAEMADEMERLGKRWLPMPQNISPVLLQLVQVGVTKPAYPFHIRPQNAGHLLVDIAWSTETEYAVVCQALASSYLNSYARWRFGTEAMVGVPDWLELAFGQMLMTSIQPALLDEMALRATEDAPLPLDQLLGAASPFSFNQEQIELNSFWLLRILQDETPSSIFPQLLARLVAGGSIESQKDAFRIAIDMTALSGWELEVWWATAFQNTVRSRLPAFQSMEQSRQNILELAFITAKIKGEDRRLAIKDVWSVRKNERVQDALRNRVRLIKLDFPRVNAVYYNAMLSLGLVYEALLGNDDANYRRLLGQFQQDLQSAQISELEVNRLLRY